MSTHFAIKTGRVAAGGSLLVGGVAGALVLAPQAGAATTFTVTNTADSGAGSLRQALDDANNNAGADIIVFDASAAGTITLTTGDLDISDDVTITGLGATNSIISGNNASRIFYIYNNAASLMVSISGLTMTGGNEYGGNGGGAIANRGNNLTLSDVVLTDNQTNGTGGAIVSAKSDAGFGETASLTIVDSEVTNNTADDLGGGLNAYLNGSITITNTVISGNTSGDSNNGGGVNLYKVGDVAIVNSSFVSNSASGGGGGVSVYYADDVSIDFTTFDQNTAVINGGGVYAYKSDSFTMTNSTVSGNEAEDGAGLRLGNNGGVLIANSTIANNVGSASTGQGGGLYMNGASGDVRIMFSTISGNSSKSNTVKMMNLSGNGVEIVGTIISDNTTQQGGGTQAADLYLSGSFYGSMSVWNSLIMGTTAGDPFANGGGNLTGVSAQLGALADNGGATFTMEPTAGSPVIDAGPLTWPAFAGDGSDQRGGTFLRVSNGQSDMGAFETQPDPTATTTTTSTTAPPPTTTTTTVGTDPMVPAFTG